MHSFTQGRGGAEKYICLRKVADACIIARKEIIGLCKDSATPLPPSGGRGWGMGALTQRNTFAYAKWLTHAEIARRGAETQRNTFAYAKWLMHARHSAF